MLGDAFRYWEFFPADRGGVVPVWGFADVIDSAVEGVDVGARVYGFLPAGSHLVVRPAHVSATRFHDASEHRTSLPPAYNSYLITNGDPNYEPEAEDLTVLYAPLFYTSWMLADQLAPNRQTETSTVVISSASSKTAYATAFLLREVTARVIGLTSPSNVAFTQGLGVYDDVIAYPAIPDLPLASTTYVDMAGSAAIRGALHDRLGDGLLAHIVVGVTHNAGDLSGSTTGPRPSMFFAPDRIAQRLEDWGREELDRRYEAAWQAFKPFAAASVDVLVSSGPEGLSHAWRTVQSGYSAPRTGHVVQF